GPRPDLLRDVREHGREEAEKYIQPEPERRARRAAAGDVPHAHLYELEVRVGEVPPEERLGLLERVRVLELLVELRHPLDEPAEPRDERAVELVIDRRRIALLLEHELAGVEELRREALSDLEDLVVE